MITRRIQKLTRRTSAMVRHGDYPDLVVIGHKDLESKGEAMTLRSLITALVSTTPALRASAHCDLPCGVYDPAQARIDAQSVKACMEKYAASSDPDFKTRALIIKEERCEAVKHHLWGPVDGLLQARAPDRLPQLARPFLAGHEVGRRSEEDQRRRGRRALARRN